MMCGILGGFLQNKFLYKVSLLKRSLENLHTRGPDNRHFKIIKKENGFFVLGHTRLSIIDLSDKANQPMYSKDRRFAIIFNGEIVNYIELKKTLSKRGHKFSTESDTEVLLAAWEEWKENAIEKLDGMFAFSVYDFKKNTLTLVRDAFGIKPLFFQKYENSVLFSSDIKVLKNINLFSNSLNYQRAYDYLQFGYYDFAGETFFKNIFSLEPGTSLTIKLTKKNIFKLNKWWNPSIEEKELSYSESVDLVRNYFLTSVKRNLRSDVPIGAALSGGIDSSAIVCGMRFLEPELEINTFSYIDKNPIISEEQWINKVNTFTKANENKIIFEDSDLTLDFDDLITTQGEPFGGPSIYAQYRVFKAIREKNIKVSLDGQGADEMFGGYNGFPGYRIHSLIDTGKYLQSLQFINAWSNYMRLPKKEAIKRLIDSMTSGYTNYFLKKISNTIHTKIYIDESNLRENSVNPIFNSIYKNNSFKERRMISHMKNALTRFGLQSLLRHGDRNSMRFSIESRVPFLTKDLANLVLSFPENYIVSNNGQPKSLFRDAMKDIVPKHILLRRDKIGFEVTGKKILFNMKEKIYNWLDHEIDVPFLKLKLIHKEFDQFFSGKKKYSHELWRIINFYRWYLLNFVK